MVKSEWEDRVGKKYRHPPEAILSAWCKYTTLAKEDAKNPKGRPGAILAARRLMFLLYRDTNLSMAGVEDFLGRSRGVVRGALRAVHPCIEAKDQETLAFLDAVDVFITKDPAKPANEP